MEITNHKMVQLGSQEYLYISLRPWRGFDLQYRIHENSGKIEIWRKKKGCWASPDTLEFYRLRQALNKV